MAADHRQTAVKLDVGLGAPSHGVGVRPEPGAQQITEQPVAIGGARQRQAGGVEAGNVPALAGEGAPTVVGLGSRALVHRAQELVVADRLAGALGIGEHGLAPPQRRHRGVGMEALDAVQVGLEDAALQRFLADHVLGDEQEPAPGHPRVVGGDDRGELGHAAGAGIAGEEQVEHGHEMALAAAEAAVEDRRLGARRLDRLADERQRGVEAVAQLGGDDIVGERLICVVDALGQLQHEVALEDLLGDVDELAQQRHRVTLLRRPRTGAAGVQARRSSALSRSSRVRPSRVSVK